MPSSDAAFADLLAQARQGDEASLAELTNRYEYEIRLVARWKLGPALRRYLDSVDLAQSVHCDLLRGLQEAKFAVSTPDQLVALAVRLMRWKIARHLRRLYRRQRLDALMAGRTEGNGETAASSPPAADPAVLAEVRDSVAQLLQGLDEPDRRLIELRLEGYTTAEAARELGADADVLRVRLGRLRKRLAEKDAIADWL